MKILHLSDLHIGYGELAERFAQLCTNVIARLTPASDYTIVITGDLVETATEPENFPQARAQLARLEAAGFTVLPVPGNHDYTDGRVALAEYIPVFKETFFGDRFLSYPKLDIVAGTAFLGLDSMAEEVNWHDNKLADGELGKLQRERLDDLLGSQEVRDCEHRVIYLHHHPFDPFPLHQLKDARALRRLLRRHRNVDALLFGHNHMGRNCNGRLRIPRCYDGGTATRKGFAICHHRLFDLHLDPDTDLDLNLLLDE